MKHKVLNISGKGATIQFNLAHGSTSGQVIVITSDDVEIDQVDAEPASVDVSAPAAPAPTEVLPAETTLPAKDLEAIYRRLLKLKPTTKNRAVNCIKMMFQFAAPLTDVAANDIFEHLCKRGLVEVDAENRIRLPNHAEEALQE